MALRILPECCAYIALLPDQNDGLNHYITGQVCWFPVLSTENIVMALALKREESEHYLVVAMENIMKATGTPGNKLFQLPKDDEHKVIEDLMNYMLSRYKADIAYALFDGKRYTCPSDLIKS